MPFVDIYTLARLFYSNTPEGIVVWVGSHGPSDGVGPVENRTLYSSLIGIDDHAIFIEQQNYQFGIFLLQYRLWHVE